MSETVHPQFNLSKNQDLNIHISESVFESFFNTWTSADGVDITKLFLDSYSHKNVTYEDICWLNMMICKHVDDQSKPLDLKVYLKDAHEVKFNDSKIELTGDVRFVFHDGTDLSELLADYTLEGLYFNLAIHNRPEFAQIYGNFESVMFHGQKINQ